MSATPLKKSDNYNFTPKELITPSKDLPGICSIVFSHISTLHKLITDWKHIGDKSAKVVRSISALKLHECYDDYYPSQLEALVDSLCDALESYQDIYEGVQSVDKKLKAVVKLHRSDLPVVFTWPANKISEEVHGICQTIQKEYELKAIITENIAHCRDEKLIEVYVSAWEFEAYFDIESTAYLFAEVGLPGVT